MKKLLLAMTVVLGAFAGVCAQATVKVYTSPKLPMRDALERMNLAIAWNTRVSVDGNRDGIFSVQVIPGKTNQLVVQTYKGGVFLYDADTGDLIWKTQVGVPYWAPQPAAFNSHSIMVTRRNVLHVLKRFDGTQRVYTFDPGTKQADFGYELSFTPNAAPVADEEFLYLSMGDRVSAIFIPDFLRIDRARLERDKRKKEGKPPSVYEDDIPEGPDSAQPSFYWNFRFADQFTSSPPLLFGDQLSTLTTDGTLTSVSRYETGARDELFAFKAAGKSAGAAGQHQNMAYVGSDDFNLYAIDMNNGRLIWRYVSSAPILRGPDVNDRDVFISPERVGLRRIDRFSGRELWINRDAPRFLAANHAFVYALDAIGRFNVIDGRRGTTLATLNLSTWAIPVVNEWTDRVYLAANDGQVMCLRHRDLKNPLVMKTLEAPKAKEEKKPMVDPKKDDEKKEDKKDDKEKAARVGRLFDSARAREIGASRRTEITAALDDHPTWARR